MSRHAKKMMAALAAVGILAVGEGAVAQFGPINPYSPPAPAGYAQQAPGYVYPVSPGGIVTGNPSPVYPAPAYDPNAVVGGNGGGTAYWDPYRGWVTNTQNTTVLNSATSPGREPVPGSQVQYYNQWDGTKWVQGTRWLGQDGQWHGNNTNTVVGPNGSVHQDHTFYAPNPNAGNRSASQPSRQPQRPHAPAAPSFIRPAVR